MCSCQFSVSSFTLPAISISGSIYSKFWEPVETLFLDDFTYESPSQIASGSSSVRHLHTFQKFVLLLGAASIALISNTNTTRHIYTQRTAVVSRLSNLWLCFIFSMLYLQTKLHSDNFVISLEFYIWSQFINTYWYYFSFELNPLMFLFHYFIRDEPLIQRVNNLMNPFSAK